MLNVLTRNNLRFYGSSFFVPFPVKPAKPSSTDCFGVAEIRKRICWRGRLHPKYMGLVHSKRWALVLRGEICAEHRDGQSNYEPRLGFWRFHRNIRQGERCHFYTNFAILWECCTSTSHFCAATRLL